MRRHIIIFLMLIVAIITLSTSFISSKNIIDDQENIKFVHPEAGYIENIGN